MFKLTPTRLLILGLSVMLSLTAVWVITIQYRENAHCCDIEPLRNVMIAVQETLNFYGFYSEVGQDKWVIGKAFPGEYNGFFVDVGSADGTIGSNTKTLEEIGWKGICIDPFPTNMAERSCRLFEEVVSASSGRTVSFRKAGFLGGIDDHLGRWKDKEFVKKAEVVEFTTESLTSILNRARAPRFIHYMSIDIEGAELDALRGLEFSVYQVGAFTIEHNFEEPKRSEIRKLLEGKGYRLERTIAQDDYYVLVGAGISGDANEAATKAADG
jgi:hypothetical protein